MAPATALALLALAQLPPGRAPLSLDVGALYAPIPTATTSPSLDLTGTATASALVADDEPSTLAIVGWSAFFSAALLAWGSRAWWEDGLTPFNFNDAGFFGRDTYAGGADKVGHAYSAYASTFWMWWVYRKLGVSSRKATLYSAALVFLLFNGFEVIDGFTEFGFEHGDVIGNVVGIGAAMALQLVPGSEDYLGFRMFYWPSRDFLENDKTFLKFINDYSGMTFTLDVKAKGFLDRYGLDAPLLRLLSAGPAFGTNQYSPVRRQELKQRLLGVHVGVHLGELIRFAGDGDEGVEDTARVFDFWGIPFLGVFLMKDLNGGDWYLNFGLASRMQIGL